jgi:hypothetical protein
MFIFQIKHRYWSAWLVFYITFVHVVSAGIDQHGLCFILHLYSCWLLVLISMACVLYYTCTRVDCWYSSAWLVFYITLVHVLSAGIHQHAKMGIVYFAWHSKLLSTTVCWAHYMLGTVICWIIDNCLFLQFQPLKWMNNKKFYIPSKYAKCRNLGHQYKTDVHFAIFFN